MADRGYVPYRDEDGRVFLWKRCEIPDCSNMICLSKGETRFCWPHSDSGSTMSELIENAEAQDGPTPAPAALKSDGVEHDG